MPTTEHATTPVYQPGDTDPTPNSVRRRGCTAVHRGYLCTWDAGHDHPQHVAGTNNQRVAAVWPVTP